MCCFILWALLLQLEWIEGRRGEKKIDFFIIQVEDNVTGWDVFRACSFKDKCQPFEQKPRFYSISGVHVETAHCEWKIWSICGDRKPTKLLSWSCTLQHVLKPVWTVMVTCLCLQHKVETEWWTENRVKRWQRLDTEAWHLSSRATKWKRHSLVILGGNRQICRTVTRQIGSQIR